MPLYVHHLACCRCVQSVREWHCDSSCCKFITARSSAGAVEVPKRVLQWQHDSFYDECIAACPGSVYKTRAVFFEPAVI